MKEWILLFITAAFCFSTYSFKPETPLNEKKFHVPPTNIGDYNPGYQDLMASVFWVRALQDIEVCDQGDAKGTLPEFNEEEERILQVLNRKLPPSKCHFSWVYKMVDVITELMPDFYFAYTVGGTFLSVLVDDRMGAQAIYKKGLSYFPEDWELNYRAAYHELFEMQNPKTSAVLLKKAADHGAPKWIYALAANLYSKLGQAQFAKTILESVLARNPKGLNAERLQNRLDKINELLRTHK